MGVEVVSVHFPKAGGTSLYRSLISAYGANAVRHEVCDDPVDPCSPFSLDPHGCRLRARCEVRLGETKAIHGHFHPSKYEFLSSACWITFVREPIENLISIYHFWPKLTDGHRLWQYARDRPLTLPEFARLPLLRYLMSRTYFGGVDMGRFDFVGFADRYSHDLRAVARRLGVSLPEARDNVNTSPAYEATVRSLLSERRLVASLRDCLIEDVWFYERLRTKWEGRAAA